MSESKEYKKAKRSELILKVLETIGHLSLGTIDLLDRLAIGGRYLSKDQYRDLMRGQNKRHDDWDRQMAEKREKQNIYNLLYRMQTSGLIDKKTKNDKVAWSVTPKGGEKREILKIQMPFKKKYVLESSKNLVIVIFDVPEIDKLKRDLLRSILRKLNFKILQKSVWIGPGKLPQDLLNDLEKFNLLPYIKMFSVLENKIS